MNRIILIVCLTLIGLSAIAQGSLNPNATKKDSAAPKVIIKPQENALTEMYDSVYQARIKMARIDGVYIPRDLNDCFRELDKLMDDDVRERFMAFSDEEVDARTHKSLGMWLKHKWSLESGSRLSHYFNEMQVPHYEYMIGIIIQSYHRYLHKRDIKIKEQVLRFRKMWQEKQQKKAEKLLETGEKAPK